MPNNWEKEYRECWDIDGKSYERIKSFIKSQKELSVKETLDKIEKEFNNSSWFHNQETAFVVLSNVIYNLKKSIKL